MGKSFVFPLALAGLLASCAIAACSATNDASGGDDDEEKSSRPGGGSSSSGPIFNPGDVGGQGPLNVEPPCDDVLHLNTDEDGDGWTGAQGDCNDCTAEMNPGALDYAGNNIDEDCNGVPDDTPVACDGALPMDGVDGMDGARAIGLCKVATAEGWGVISAAYVRSDGQPLTSALEVGRGILPAFGAKVVPQEGAKLLALSSGTARQPNDPGYEWPSGYWKDHFAHSPPPGFPKESPSCPGVATGTPYDSAGLRLVIKTPTNAKSLSFNLNFYTFEFPKYICSKYNDFFVALLSPKPANQPDGNISFDSQGNSISVNAGFLEVCSPQMAGGKHFPCALGPDDLAGTGFEGAAATGWLQTSSPLAEPGGTIELLFTIWDSGDGSLDSTTLIDNFQFAVTETPTVTAPVDAPK